MSVKATPEKTNSIKLRNKYEPIRSFKSDEKSTLHKTRTDTLDVTPFNSFKYNEPEIENRGLLSIGESSDQKKNSNTNLHIVKNHEENKHVS
jgi:hypothetical protein